MSPTAGGVAGGATLRAPALDSAPVVAAGRRPAARHGAFADSSSLNDVNRRLQRDGCPGIAPAKSLRDLAGDSAYVASVPATIERPVIGVGHSYLVR